MIRLIRSRDTEYGPIYVPVSLHCTNAGPSQTSCFTLFFMQAAAVSSQVAANADVRETMKN